MNPEVMYNDNNRKTEQSFFFSQTVIVHQNIKPLNPKWAVLVHVMKDGS